MVAVLSDQILASDASSVDFLSIDQSYKNLILEIVARGTTIAATVNVRAQFNSDTGTNYYYQRQDAVSNAANYGSSTASVSHDIGDIAAASASTGAVGYIRATISDYSRAVFRKLMLQQSVADGGDATGNIRLDQRGLVWHSTAAITAIHLFPNAGNFLAGSRFMLYGY